MSFIKKLNPLKRKIFKQLTGSFRNSNNINQLTTTPKDNIKHILVTRPNHRLGNQLLFSPLIQVLETEFPNCKIDLLVNGGLSKILYANYDSVDNIFNLPKKPFKNLRNYVNISLKVIFKKYDLAIPADENSNSGKIFVKLSRAKYKVFNAGDRIIPSVHISKKPIDNLLTFLRDEQQLNNIEYPRINLKVNSQEFDTGKKIVHSYFNNQLPIIGVFTNATGSKKLSKEWWHKLAIGLETSFPNANIFEILPKENTSQLDFKYTSYYSEDIREMAGVIENCTVFIGADSGVMHLATATNTPSFGLFNGATNPDTYGPYGKDKFVVETHKLEIPEIMKIIKPYI